MGFEYFLPVNSLPLFEKKKAIFREALQQRWENCTDSLFICWPETWRAFLGYRDGSAVNSEVSSSRGPSLVPNTHARQLATSCSSSCRGSNVSGLHGHPYACKEHHEHTIKNKSRKSLLHFAFYKTAIKIHELWTGNFHLNISIHSWWCMFCYLDKCVMLCTFPKHPRPSQWVLFNPFTLAFKWLRFKLLLALE